MSTGVSAETRVATVIGAKAPTHAGLVVKLAALARIFQLASPALPIGGYSHSQGLESAIERGVVADETAVLQWITHVLEFSLMTFEIPMLVSMSAAWAGGSTPALHALNAEFMATRESAELRASTAQMGYSLRALLGTLPDFPVSTLDILQAMDEPSLPCVWSAAATAWEIATRESALAYAWSWAENQVLVAMKAIPLGQSAGQRILFESAAKIAAGLERDLRAVVPAVLAEDALAGFALSNFTPGLAILSAQHETQYSRLFRS